MLNFIADFYCYKLKLVIELDGYTHDFEENVFKDELKIQKLESYGLTVIRFTDDEVLNNLEGVMYALEEFAKLDKG